MAERLSEPDCYAVKNASGWILPWTVRSDAAFARSAYQNIYPANVWDGLKCANGYSVVPVKLVEVEEKG